MKTRIKGGVMRVTCNEGYINLEGGGGLGTIRYGSIGARDHGVGFSNVLCAAVSRAPLLLEAASVGFCGAGMLPDCKGLVAAALPQPSISKLRWCPRLQASMP